MSCLNLIKEVHDLDIEIENKKILLQRKLISKFNEMYAEFANSPEILTFSTIQDYESKLIINQLQYGLFYSPKTESKQQVYSFKDLPLFIQGKILSILEFKNFKLLP